MKKTILVVLLALVLTIAFASSAFATTGKFYKGGIDYYSWSGQTGSFAPGTAFVMPAATGKGMNLLANNVTVGGGPHSGYTATTAKCGVCHSVHRAKAGGSKLTAASDASCTGCHASGTTVTTKIVTWTPYSTTWVPAVDYASYSGVGGTGHAGWYADMQVSGATRRDVAMAAITNKAAAGGAATTGGPHNDSLINLIEDGIWDGLGTPPAPDYEGARYGCFTRRCHATNPHGANSSQYTMFAQKLLFNESADADQDGDGTYGGEDAIYDAVGATDASVQRFAAANPTIVTLSGGDILINGVAPDANEQHALVAGLTCGRPSNPSTGEDECHAEASYAIVDKGIREHRNHATGIVGNNGSNPLITDGNAYRTDNTGVEALGFGGNDNRDWKTGHVAGTFAAQNAEGSYVAIAGCTGCHDQTDSGNTTAGNFTFPHGQAAQGATTNLYLADGTTPAGNVRSRIWMGYAGDALGNKRITDTAATAYAKAFDGQCLKCHRDGAGNGIGLTK